MQLDEKKPRHYLLDNQERVALWITQGMMYIDMHARLTREGQYNGTYSAFLKQLHSGRYPHIKEALKTRKRY